mgnify:CR=1 FL=1
MASAERRDGTAPALPESNVAERTRVRRPRRFQVVLHNDDYTTMDFVVQVLMSIFHKQRAEATQIMFEVHEKGRGVCGVYPADVARTKVTQVTELARAHEFPLLCTAEPLNHGSEGA